MSADIIDFQRAGRTLIAARVVPWESGGLFGVAAEWSDGWSDCYVVGDEKTAAAELRRIRGQRDCKAGRA